MREEGKKTDLWRNSSLSRRGRGREAALKLPLSILQRARLRLAPSLLWASSSVNRKKSFWARRQWLDIWKSSALFRGLPPHFPGTLPCSHRLQTASLRETVSLQRELRWHPQHHCVDVYSLDRASRLKPSLIWSLGCQCYFEKAATTKLGSYASPVASAVRQRGCS